VPQSIRRKNVSYSFVVKEVEKMNYKAAVRNKRFKLHLYLNFPLNVNYLSRNKVTLKKQNVTTLQSGVF